MAIAGDKRVTVEDMRSILGITKMTPEPTPDKGEALGKAKLDDEGNVIVYEATIAGLAKALQKDATALFKTDIAKTIAKVTADDILVLENKMTKTLDDTQKEILERNANAIVDLTALAESVRPLEIKIGKKIVVLSGVQHNQFANLLTVVAAREPVLMVGPAGTGKTHAAEMVAQALSLAFYSISVGSQTSKSDLVGYMHAAGGYVPTQFRKAYETGGVFLLDEADAGNSNVLILLNAALSNGYMAFPDSMVKVHDDFRMIATANTFGHGASRQYVGRNQLDAATLDRFVTLTWDIDDNVELNMAGATPQGKKWLSVVRAVRKRVVDELELRIVVSPRATKRGAILLAAGMSFAEVLPIALTGNMPAGERKEIENLAKSVWTK